MRITPVSILLASLTLAALHAHAMTGVRAPDASVLNLPDLAVPDNSNAYFDFALEGAELGYETHIERWGARLYRDEDLGPSVSVDYGQLFNNKFGAGGTYTLQSDTSEMVVNGIYAPKKNVRIRFAGAELRSTGHHAGLENDSDAVMQRSYLVGAKKYWTKYKLLSDIGISAYTVAASTNRRMDVDSLDTEFASPGSAVPGRMDGYMLDLNLRPTAQSTLELRYETSQLTYLFDSRERRDEQLASNLVRYSHYLDNCVQVQGGYRVGSDAERMELGLTRNNWSLQFAREQDGSYIDKSIRIGYVLPLGGKPSDVQKCRVRSDSPPSFESIIDASIKRPQQFPREPLVTTDIP